VNWVEFRTWRHGESKLDTLVVWEYFALLADKFVGHIVPVRFALFGLIGLVGVAVHMSILWTDLAVFSLAFGVAQSLATLIAMTSNFFLNNVLTYRDQRLRGWRLVRGLASFYG
jgi:dolichol-phosphate mannosyltransferase